VLAEFERRFTVYAMDRRGRGQSGDSPSYSLLREAQDIPVVAEAAGGSVNVLGHSQGALCALEASLLTSQIRTLILYEGVPLRGADEFEPGVIDRLDAKLAAGDVEGVVIGMLGDIAHMPIEEIELLRSQQPAWSVRVSNARTIPRELLAYERYVFVPERFERSTIPTLLLVGGESPPRELQNAERVARAFARGRVLVLPDQQHIAMHTAPDVFVGAIVEFLSGT
jgi:pimeloyl-ACP methyl ester carboxylesterase